MREIGIIDYQAGNLASVQTALAHLGASFITSRYPDKLKKAHKLLFPGVGNAVSALAALKRFGLDDFIKDWAGQGRLLLGICVGCQVLLTTSEEGEKEPVTCLDIINGQTRRFSRRPDYKVPHMGWNEVHCPTEHPLFAGIPKGSSFYFVHSYYPRPLDRRHSLCYSDYGGRFDCGLARDNILGVQFHPEKSGGCGLQLLDNFIKL